MANPHPEPHPENLRPHKKGDPHAKETGRKGAIASNKKQAQKRSMREWAVLLGELPIQKDKLKDPKVAADLAKDPNTGRPKANLTMDGAVLAAMYAKATKGDVRAAEFLAKLKGQTSDDVVVHIDTMAQMETSELLALYEKTKRPKE